MKRSQTSTAVSIPYDRANAQVDFVTPQPPVPGYPDFQVRFTFAPHGKFDSFLHFHSEHSEHLYCESGQIRLTLGTEVRMVGKGDGIVEIPMWMPHRWEVLGDCEEKTVVWERNSPDPEFKELFFRSVITSYPKTYHTHRGNSGTSSTSSTTMMGILLLCKSSSCLQITTTTPLALDISSRICELPFDSPSMYLANWQDGPGIIVFIQITRQRG
jgi:quercetin dioxygenase-like cupin family protein